MALRYIQKNKNGKWAISSTKTGKAIRVLDTQKEALAIAGSMKSTEGILIKRSGTWQPISDWDKKAVNILAPKASPKKVAATSTEKKQIKPKIEKKINPSNKVVEKPSKKKNKISGLYMFSSAIVLITVVILTIFLIAHYAFK